MDIDRGLKWRLMITAMVALGLLAYFVERMSFPRVVSAPRSPASVEKVLPACEDSSCVPSSSSDESSVNEIEGMIKPVKGDS
jgi:hypothetical protein